MTELCYWLGASNQRGLHSFRACCCSIRTHFTTQEKSVTTILCIHGSEFHSLWHSYSCGCAHHGDIWGSQGICPLVLSLGTRLRWLVSFVHQHLYIWGKSSLCALNRRLGGLQGWSWHFGEDKHILYLVGIQQFYSLWICCIINVKNMSADLT